MFGVPTATCDRATSFSARFISGYDVGNSICKLTRWERNTVYGLLAVVPAWLPSDTPHATNSSDALILSASEAAASKYSHSAINPQAVQDQKPDV